MATAQVVATETRVAKRAAHARAEEEKLRAAQGHHFASGAAHAAAEVAHAAAEVAHAASGAMHRVR
jgi:hypothetical protein